MKLLARKCRQKMEKTNQNIAGTYGDVVKYFELQICANPECCVAVHNYLPWKTAQNLSFEKIAKLHYAVSLWRASSWRKAVRKAEVNATTVPFKKSNSFDTFSRPSLFDRTGKKLLCFEFKFRTIQFNTEIQLICNFSTGNRVGKSSKVAEERELC